MSDLEELKRQRAELDAKIKALGNPKSWPQDRDWCYAIGEDGSVIEYLWASAGYPSRVLAQGNIFRTRDEALKERDRRAVTQKLKAYAGDWVPDWKDGGQAKHHIWYDHAYDRRMIGLECVGQVMGVTYFPSWDTAMEAIKELGDELLVLFDV